MAEAHPDVTVVIPTRNRREFLCRTALPAALGQEGVEVEVVLVDDGSTDGTAEHVEALHDRRLRVLRHARPLGVARARNAGIGAAAGEWIAFLDDDDVWSPAKLHEQLRVAREAGADWAYAGGLAVDPGGRVRYEVPAAEPRDLARSLLRENVLWGAASNVVARTSLVRALGGFDESFFQLADWDLSIRLALAAPAAACRAPLIGIVQHGGSMLVTERADVFGEFELLLETHRGARRRLGVQVNRRAFAWWVAQGHRRAGRRRAAARAYLRGATGATDVGALAHAAGALLGEQAMAVGAALTRGRGPRAADDAPAAPAWLRRYGLGESAAGARTARTVISSS